MFAADLMPSLEIYFYFYRVHAYIRNGWASNVVDPDAKDEKRTVQRVIYCVYNYLILPLMAGSH